MNYAELEKAAEWCDSEMRGYDDEALRQPDAADEMYSKRDAYEAVAVYLRSRISQLEQEEG